MAVRFLELFNVEIAGRQSLNAMEGSGKGQSERGVNVAVCNDAFSILLLCPGFHTHLDHEKAKANVRLRHLI